MLDVLEGEGTTDVAFLALTAWSNGPNWGDHDPGYERVGFPVMLDTAGVFYTYGVEPYDVILVDRKGRLVTKTPFFEGAVEPLNKRIRQLHAE